jgi:hypothetical protein
MITSQGADGLGPLVERVNTLVAAKPPRSQGKHEVFTTDKPSTNVGL